MGKSAVGACWPLWLLAAAVIGVRPMIRLEPLSLSGSYQAVAHILVGILVGMYAMEFISVGDDERRLWPTWLRLHLTCLICVEVVCFATDRLFG